MSVDMVLGEVVAPDVATLFSAAFDVPRDPRSLPYKRGVLAVFRFRLEHIRIEGVGPYPPGTASADAFSAGAQEGHRRWREHIDAARDAAEAELAAARGHAVKS